jgi:hypothetical protein
LGNVDIQQGIFNFGVVNFGNGDDQFLTALPECRPIFPDRTIELRGGEDLLEGGGDAIDRGWFLLV